MTITKHVTYWGRVQGVGFRYTTFEIAKRFPVVGYVKNLRDGQVELVAEGTLEDVERFLGQVAQEMGRFIKGQSVSDEAAQGFETFEIRS